MGRQKPFEQTPEYIFGREGELRVRAFLEAAGFTVLPACDIVRANGKGPRLTASNGDFVLPDYQVFRGKQRAWIEVKSKKTYTWHRGNAQAEHGINRGLWEQYHRTQERTRLPVHILIWEEQTDDLLLAGISRLARDARTAMSTKGGLDDAEMVYWPRADFAWIGNLSGKPRHDPAARPILGADTWDGAPRPPEPAGGQQTLF